ncbi:TPA: ATP-binding cassette domain-containing protein [Staphylococcus delphini]|uniref:iron ABC transporter ATP-binding protein n=1 Tax=Staphylococcus delphini TaxID=53344 RepID=UPI000BBCEACA|nr:ATP-binding cassette domain-containing protein [Staphylococcus delphini]PCF47406.1 iron ABC transporter ATP-binding protein [Staphylococcus delphini]PCF77044.1 iron ABC transporter ATP-binding protein [Staphylococcus delphini]HEC2155889.1 ATP-binding cassette domain-containing protein [Staphylococcus delphini]HEC2175813.1 ATP-binding cassette domain-containing protein [Staphylococcus delphini]
MIKVEKLTKTYHQHQVVDAVDIKIEKGKITSLIGPNGAGKSTVLAMVSRLIDKDNGKITIDGQDIDAMKSNALAKKLAILKQSNHTAIKITVRQLVSFGRFPYSKGKLKKADQVMIDQALAYLGLTDIQHQYLSELSGGQRQRAYIAMTIAQDTEYILLDEPLNNLDMKHSVQIMKILRRLVKEMNKTIVIVIHDINFASCYSDHIIALKEGEVAIAGLKNDVINAHVLRDIYDIDIKIQEMNGQRICVYFDNDANEENMQT